MNIGIGSDHAGFRLKAVLKAFLEKMGHELRDFGTDSDQSVDYPRFIRPVAEAVQKKAVERGIVIGGSGNGEAMAANRLRGVRCALCWNRESARLARAHNDANMVSLGARLITEKDALEIVRIWLETPFEEGRHLRRIKQMDGDPAHKSIDVQQQKPESEAPPEMEAAWDILIAFRYIVYMEGDNRIEFQIDPGLKSPSVVHFPGRERWDTDLPAWARGRRDEIMERIKSKCGHLTYEINEY